MAVHFHLERHRPVSGHLSLRSYLQFHGELIWTDNVTKFQVAAFLVNLSEQDTIIRLSMCCQSCGCLGFCPFPVASRFHVSRSHDDFVRSAAGGCDFCDLVLQAYRLLSHSDQSPRVELVVCTDFPANISSHAPNGEREVVEVFASEGRIHSLEMGPGGYCTETLHQMPEALFPNTGGMCLIARIPPRLSNSSKSAIAHASEIMTDAEGALLSCLLALLTCLPILSH